MAEELAPHQEQDEPDSGPEQRALEARPRPPGHRFQQSRQREQQKDAAIADVLPPPGSSPPPSRRRSPGTLFRMAASGGRQHATRAKLAMAGGAGARRPDTRRSAAHPGRIGMSGEKRGEAVRADSDAPNRSVKFLPAPHWRARRAARRDRTAAKSASTATEAAARTDEEPGPLAQAQGQQHGGIELDQRRRARSADKPGNALDETRGKEHPGERRQREDEEVDIGALERRTRSWSRTRRAASARYRQPPARRRQRRTATAGTSRRRSARRPWVSDVPRSSGRRPEQQRRIDERRSRARRRDWSHRHRSP